MTNALFAASAVRWSGCYPGEEATHFLEIGVVADHGFFLAYGSEAQALKAIEGFVASANMVLAFQVNVQLRVRQVLMVSSSSALSGMPAAEASAYGFFEASRSGALGVSCVDPGECVCSLDGAVTSCAADAELCGINQHLQAVTEFSHSLYASPPPGGAFSPPSASASTRVEFAASMLEAVPALHMLAHWHLLTDCFRSGTVGVAWALQPSSDQPRRGTMCLDGLNTAVTSRTDFTWLTLLHEVGHGFGLDHSFEEGQGQTDGVMDYQTVFDIAYEGAVQFNEEYRREELCGELSLMKASPFVNGCSRAGHPNYFAAENTACAAGDVAQPKYCLGGYCPPARENQTTQECLPIPAQLVFDGDVIPFQGTFLGQQVSAYGAPKLVTWRVDAGNLCAGGETYADTDVVIVDATLVCTLDIQVDNAVAAGAAGLAIINSNDELGLATGNSVDAAVKVAVVASSDGARMQSDVAAAELLGATVEGYLGASPLETLPGSTLSSSFVFNEEADGPNFLRDNLSVILVIGGGVAVTGMLLLMLSVTRPRPPSGAQNQLGLYPEMAQARIASRVSRAASGASQSHSRSSFPFAV